MFALFKTTDGGVTYDFVDYILNTEDQKFLGNLLFHIDLEAVDVKIFKYDKLTFKKYMKHQNSMDNTSVLTIENSGIIKKQKITQFKKMERDLVDPSDFDASDYYSDAAILAHAENKLDIGNAATPRNPWPDMVHKDVVVQVETRNELENIIGVEIDVAAVIAAENA